jgi:hypothetical protein
MLEVASFSHVSYAIKSIDATPITQPVVLSVSDTTGT